MTDSRDHAIDIEHLLYYVMTNIFFSERLVLINLRSRFCEKNQGIILHIIV